MIGHCNKTTWNNGLKLQKAPLLYICSSHAERLGVDTLLKNGHILLCTSIYLVNQFILNNFLPIGQRRPIVPYSESACKTASDRMCPHLYFDHWIKIFIFTSFVSDSAVKAIILAILS